MNEDDLTTAQGIAMIGILLLLIVPVAMALAIWLKRRFAQAVVRLQFQTARSPAAASEETAPDARLLRAMSEANTEPSGHPKLIKQPAPALHVRRAVDVRRSSADPAGPGRRLRAAVLGAQLLFGIAYWFVLMIIVGAMFAHLSQGDAAAAGEVVESAVPTAKNSESGGWTTAMSHLAGWPLLLAPPMLAWAIQAGARTRWVWTGFAVGMACVAAGMLLGGTLDLQETTAGVVGLTGLGLMTLTFLRPDVRGAGPPLVAALIAGWLALCALFGIALAIEPLLEEAGASSADEPITTSEWIAALVILAPMLAASAWVGWRIMLRIARRYAQKRYSELQLALGAYWGLITAFGIGLVLMAMFDDKEPSAEAFTLAALLMLVWWIWRWLQRMTLKWPMRHPPPALEPMLLLRVFKPSSRSEEFMDRFLARWRFAAPVWMIAGPDLAGAYMEPDEFFAYISRNLQSRFITTPDEVPTRLAAMDDKRDPDGRFRVNDLYCSNSTWKPAVLAMIDKAGVIVLDLREYTRQRAGTRFELRELLARATLEKVILLVDERDNLDDLRAEVEELWHEVAAARQPADDSPHALDVLTLGADNDAQLRGLVNAVADAAARAPAANLKH